MVEISRWDASEYFETEQDIIDYLNAAAELDDPALLQAAIGDVAKARGMTQIAEEAEVGRESLYKSLNKEENPSFRTIAKVIHALGGHIESQGPSRRTDQALMFGHKQQPTTQQNTTA